MKTTGCYYMILTVYISLWSCQVITCHLTHSLIVLTDSYINLYKIVDISLGILHLRTQRRARERHNGELQGKASNGMSPIEGKFTLRLFNAVCTYNFKRLPVLGAFVNGLFLAALLLSAAIEGIQTCFHASHSDPNGRESILLENPETYPAILVGFALVGAMMQWCSVKTHKMREQELGSESLIDLSGKGEPLSVIDAEQLMQRVNASGEIFRAPTQTNCRANGARSSNPCLSLALNHKQSDNKFVLNKTKLRSFESVALDNTHNEDHSSKISLRSLRLVPDDMFDVDLTRQRESSTTTVSSISKDLESEGSSQDDRDLSLSDRWWLVVRYCISPVALIGCALIIYFIHDDMVTEVADATFAILVVILLFTASYPPMKKAGKIILQTAPDGVDLCKLKRSLMSISPLVVDITELHVWSLTARSNRVATCQLCLNKDKIESEKQLSDLLRQASSKFQAYNIKCSTIQPVFVEPTR